MCSGGNASRLCGVRRHRISVHMFQDMFSHEDGHAVRDPQGDGVTGAGVDFDGLPMLFHDELGVVRVVAQIADDDADQLAAEVFDHAGQQVVRLWTFDGHAAQTTFDRRRLEKSDDDRHGTFAVDLTQLDELILACLGDQNAGQFHLNIRHTRIVASIGHGGK